MLYALLLWAEEEAPRGGLFNLNFILPMLLMLFVFIVLFPGQRARERERLNQLQTSLEKNDRVLTVAGIYGTVSSISDKEDEILVKVDDNVKLRMTRSSIARNLTKEEKARQAKDEKAAGK